MLTKEDILNIDLNKINRVHFIGITAPRNAFCAEILIKMGKKVTASQFPYAGEEKQRQPWEKRGILYPGGHQEKYVNKNIDLVVYPNAPIPGNLECEKAEKLKIPAITVGQLTGILSKKFKTIAIAGTQGKTTTTAMIVWMIDQILGRPNFLIGDANDKILQIGKNWQISKKTPFLVLEACEYKKQFLDRAPSPYVSVITNLGLDHTDFFKTQKNYNRAFAEFILNTKSVLVIDAESKNEREILAKVGSRLKSNGVKIIDVSKLAQRVRSLKLIIPGKHNLENAKRAIGAGLAIDLPLIKIIRALSTFQGVSSRFEFLGKTRKNNPVYRDYAHNPEKIAACINSAREAHPGNKILLVFQPHNFERSYSFRNEFGQAIKNADFVLIPNIYSARESEKDKSLISEQGFAALLKKANPGKKIKLTRNFENTAKEVAAIEAENQNLTIVLASAGDLGKIIPLLHLKK